MKVFRSRLGLSSGWLVFLTILPALLIVWLPLELTSKTSVSLLISAILSSLAIYFALRIFPKQSILVCCDDFVIINRFSTRIFEEITDIQLVDTGSISGWMMILSNPNLRTEPVRVPFSQIHLSENLLAHIKTNAEKASVSYHTKLFGSLSEWIIALEASLFVVGAFRLVLAAVA